MSCYYNNRENKCEYDWFSASDQSEKLFEFLTFDLFNIYNKKIDTYNNTFVATTKHGYRISKINNWLIGTLCVYLILWIICIILMTTGFSNISDKILLYMSPLHLYVFCLTAKLFYKGCYYLYCKKFCLKNNDKELNNRIFNNDYKKL